jgi:hypothetical protein
MKAELRSIVEFFQMLDELEHQQKKRLGEKWLEMEKGELQTVIDASKLLDEIPVISEIRVHSIPGGDYGARVVYEETGWGSGKNKKDFIVGDRHDGSSIGDAVTKALDSENCHFIISDFHIKEV